MAMPAQQDYQEQQRQALNNSYYQATNSPYSWSNITGDLKGDLSSLINAPAWQYYPGQLTPDMNPLLAGSFGNALSWMNSEPMNTGIAGGLEAASNLAGGGYNPWGGPMGGMTADAISGAMQMPNAQLNLDPAAQAALSGFMGGGSNPYLEQAIQAATKAPVKALQEQIIPGLDAQYLGAGQYGGSRQMLDVGKAVEATTGQVGDIASRMYANAYESDAGRRMQALGLSTDIASQNANLGLASTAARLNAAGMGLEGQRLGLQGQQIGLNALPGMAMLPGQIAQAGMQMGMAQNELEQLSIDKEAQAFLYNQQARGMQLEQAMSLLPYLFPNKYKGGSTGGGTSSLGAALGGAVAGYGAGAGTPAAPYLAAAGAVGGYLSAR